LTTNDSPTFAWDPVTGAERYRARIYNSDSSRSIWWGTTADQPTLTVPPGALKQNAMYRLRLEAWDAPGPGNLDNLSKIPSSNSDNYIFYTGDEQAVEPFIDLGEGGVRSWNDHTVLDQMNR
jgi:hypothetical protein